MVARLIWLNMVWLKWRLLVNGLRHDRQRLIGFPILIGFVAFGAFALAARFMDTAEALPSIARVEYSLWGSLLLWIGWMTLPVLLFPLDETLSPAKFAHEPIPPLALVMGLTGAGFVTPPIIVPIVLVAANLGILLGSQGLVLAVLASVALLVILVMSTQLFSATVTSILRTRHGRDLIFLVIGGLGFAIFFIQQRIAQTVGDLGLTATVLEFPLSPVTWLIPPVAAQQAIVQASQGNALAAVGALGAACVWIVVIGWVWLKVINWITTTPEAPERESSTSSAGLLRGSRWSTVAAVAAKELRFYRRDPRMRMVWTGGVVFLGIISASLVVGSTQLETIRNTPAITLTAPAVVLFVGLPIALNQFGWERNAASFLFALPVTAKQLVLGKNLATASALAVEAIVLSIIFAAFSDGWAMLGYAPFLIATAILCQLAVGNIVSVLAPMRLPPMGTDLFAQATEQGCLALVSQMGAFAVIGVLMIPPASGFTLLTVFGVDSLRYRIGFALGSLVWGFGLYMLGLWFGTRLLNRRIPEMVTAVQTV